MAFAEFVARLRAASDVPIIVVTADVMPDAMNEYERLAVAGVLRKPFHSGALLAEIQLTVIRRSGNWRDVRHGGLSVDEQTTRPHQHEQRH